MFFVSFTAVSVPLVSAHQMFPVLKKLINETFECMLQYIIKQKNEKKNDCLGCSTTLSLKRCLLTMVLLSFVYLLNHSQIQVFLDHKVLESIILFFPISQIHSLPWPSLFCQNAQSKSSTTLVLQIHMPLLSLKNFWR